MTTARARLCAARWRPHRRTFDCRGDWEGLVFSHGPWYRSQARDIRRACFAPVSVAMAPRTIVAADGRLKPRGRPNVVPCRGRHRRARLNEFLTPEGDENARPQLESGNAPRHDGRRHGERV